MLLRTRKARLSPDRHVVTFPKSFSFFLFFHQINLRTAYCSKYGELEIKLKDDVERMILEWKIQMTTETFYTGRRRATCHMIAGLDHWRFSSETESESIAVVHLASPVESFSCYIFWIENPEWFFLTFCPPGVSISGFTPVGNVPETAILYCKTLL